MSKSITLKELQEDIRNRDHNLGLKDAYYYKLVEEVGELGNALRKNNIMGKKTLFKETGNLKGSVEEELYDVLYYISAIANLHDIDLEECIRLKEDFNSKRTSGKF